MLNKEQAVKKLLIHIADSSDVQYDRAFISDFMDKLNVPNFEMANTISDWQSYIPPEVREFWHFSDDITRIFMWMMASQQIPKEEST